LFNQSTTSTFLERLHPQRLRHVRDGLGEPMKGRGLCIQSSRESLPPRIEEGTHGIERPATDSRSDFLHRGPKAALLAATQRLTPENRLNAFLKHCRLMMEFRHAGRELQAAKQRLPAS
jgi:hypothetical protein